jgi:hypothetical protein
MHRRFSRGMLDCTMAAAKESPEVSKKFYKSLKMKPLRFGGENLARHWMKDHTTIQPPPLSTASSC